MEVQERKVRDWCFCFFNVLLKCKTKRIILSFKSLNFGFSKAELSNHHFFINNKYSLSLPDCINILKGGGGEATIIGNVERYVGFLMVSEKGLCFLPLPSQISVRATNGCGNLRTELRLIFFMPGKHCLGVPMPTLV